MFLEWLAILACALALAWWAFTGGLTARFDNALLDRLATATAHPASDDVLIVAIDDRSLAEAGRWPWDRTKVAQLLDRLTAAGAKSVLLDVLYTEPSSAQSDRALAQAMARARNVALPFGLTPAEGRSDGFDPVPPIADLAAQAVATGHVAITPDPDGTVRRLALTFTDATGRQYRHLSAELYRADSGKASLHYPETDYAPLLQLRPSGNYRTISAAAVLRGEVQAQFIKDKVVIIGATAPGLGDLFPVSASAGSMMSGAELQANLFQDIADNGFIEPLPMAHVIGFSCGLIVLLFIGFWRLRPSLCLALAIALAVTSLAAALLLAAGWKQWLPPGPALLALIVAYPLWGWRRLVAVSQFLESEATKLEPVAGPAAATLGGFDTIAQQVSRLDFLVDEVAARRDFLRRVIESTPDALCAFDASDGLVLMNGRAEALFGETTEGLALHDLLAAMPGHFNADANELELEDGRTFAVTHSGGLAQAGLETIHIVQFTDITATRKAEKERRHMLEFLSHDMRSPQVAILGLAGQQAHDDDEAARFARIRSHARRTMELADNFIQLARLGEVPLALEELDLGMIADEARDRAWSGARDRQITLSVSLPEEPIFVRVDGQVLSRVLDNLIGNAIRYGNERGSIRISLERAGSNLEQACLAIADDGPGLPEDRRADPFRRYGPHGDGGTGLGLAFVSEAIARHGGTILCESPPGKGTQFTIHLPALADISDE